jgi:MFS family permease
MVTCLLPALNLGTSSWWIYPVFIVIGATTIGSGGVYTAMAGEMGGDKAAGTSVGVITAVAGSGYLIGPPLFGAAVDLTGSYRMAWLLMTVCGVISVVLISLVRERPTDGAGCPRQNTKFGWGRRLIPSHAAFGETRRAAI